MYSAARPQSPTSIPAGTVIGNYRVQWPLGSGGMAEVYYALDQRLDRPVALKVLRPSLSGDEVYQQRFLQEAKAAAALVHPNIVQIYSVEQVDNLRFIAQEYIPGSNLRSYMQADNQRQSKTGLHRVDDNQIAPITELHQGFSDKQLPINEVLSILLQVLAALSKAASLGIVHRDIKPENILLTVEGEAKVADFGLARVAQGEDPRLTTVGTTLGTPMYMSPEQIQGGAVDVRSDLYSLGVTLFHMLCGQPPYQGDTPLAMAMLHVQANIPSPTQYRSDLPDSLAKLTVKLLAKLPEDRFADPEAVLSFLHEHRKQDLDKHWPERTVPMPGVALNKAAPLEATRKLQAILNLRHSKRPRWLAQLGLTSVAAAATGVAFWLGSNLADKGEIDPEKLFNLSELTYKEIPKQPDAKSQYEWALLDRSSGRISKWEAVDYYYPSSASDLNRFYCGLSLLQLARIYADANDFDTAFSKLQSIVGDSAMPPLVRAYGWLQQASVELQREQRQKVHALVEQAWRIRETLSVKDQQQIDQAVRAMPSEIELFWSPAS